MTTGAVSRRAGAMIAGAATIALLLGGCVYFPDSVGPLRDLGTWARAQDGVVDVVDTGSELTNPANPFSGESVGVATIVLADDAGADDVVRVARAARDFADSRPDDRFALTVDGPTGGVALPEDDAALDASLALVEQAASDPDVVGIDLDLDHDSLSTLVVRRVDDAPASRVHANWAESLASRQLSADVEVVLPPGGTAAGRDALVAARSASDDPAPTGVRSFRAPSGARETIGDELALLDGLDPSSGAPAVPGLTGWRVDTTDGGTTRLGTSSLAEADAVDDAVRALAGAGSMTTISVAWDDVVIEADAGPDAPARQLWADLAARVDLDDVTVGPGALTATTADLGVGAALVRSLAEVPAAADVVLTLVVAPGDGDGQGEVRVQGAPVSSAVGVLAGLAALTDDPARVIAYVRDDGALDLYVDDRWTTQGIDAVTTALAGTTDGTAVSVDFSPVREDPEGEAWAASFTAASSLSASDLSVRAQDVDPAATRSHTTGFVDAWNRLR